MHGILNIVDGSEHLMPFVSTDLTEQDWATGLAYAGCTDP